MSRRLVLLLLLVAGAVGLFLKNYRVEGLDGLRVHRRISTKSQQVKDVLPVTRQGQTIRVGSFNVQVLGRSKSDKVVVMEILARIARQASSAQRQEASLLHALNK